MYVTKHADPRTRRPYFDVDTKDVVARMGSSIRGPIKADFLETTHDQPDLYGPFWIATTLIFVTAVAGNYADYIAFSNKGIADSGSGTAAPPGNSTLPAGQLHEHL